MVVGEVGENGFPLRRSCVSNFVGLDDKDTDEEGGGRKMKRVMDDKE